MRNQRTVGTYDIDVCNRPRITFGYCQPLFRRAGIVYRSQFSTNGKSLVIYLRHTTRYGDGGQISAGRKSVFAQSGRAVGNNHVSQPLSTAESATADNLDGFAQSQGNHCLAVIKSAFAYIRRRVGDDDARQFFAVIKSRLANGL